MDNNSEKRDVYMENQPMMQPATLEQFILHLYRETSASETLQLLESLERDPVLREDCEELREAYLDLPKATFHPSDEVIQRILAYSEKIALEPYA